MFLAMSWSAEFKNYNSTLCILELFPFDTFASPEHNFLTLSSNDTKLSVHASCNEWKGRV